MMKTVHVSTGRCYDIYIGEGILSKAAELVSDLGLGGRAMIVSDDTVAALYLDKLKRTLTLGGYDVYSFVFAHGESSKCACTYLALLDALAEAHFSRMDAVFALGGGVVGDLAGFAAATYMRGIRFVGIPTTLLACVDSSVGGKTAIDISAGKNLVGAFWQPSAVICDPSLLGTLPEEYFSDGMAEVIKYAMIADASILDIIKDKSAKKNIVELIERCVSIKRDIVEQDEREGGIRALLNFGHTAAHGIESESEYEISHGRAVGMGMALITKASSRMGLCSEKDYLSLCSVLCDYALDTECPYSADILYTHALSDKKACEKSISLIMCRGVGRCEIRKTPTEELCSVFELGK